MNGVKGAQLSVLLALNHDTDQSTYQMAALTGYAPITIRRAVQALEQAKLIKVHRRGRGRRNAYLLLKPGQQAVRSALRGGKHDNHYQS